MHDEVPASLREIDVRPFLSVALMLVLAGCVGPVSPNASDTALVPAQTTLKNCREFTAQVTVEGQPRRAVGQTCQQPDGGWQFTLDTPGLPQQVYTLPPQAIICIPTPSRTTGGTLGSMGRCLSGVRYS